MIGHGVSSFSSHSCAAGRTVPSAKPCTHSRMSFWSWLSSREKLFSSVCSCSSAAVVAMSPRGGDAPRGRLCRLAGDRRDVLLLLALQVLLVVDERARELPRGDQPDRGRRAGGLGGDEGKGGHLSPLLGVTHHFPVEFGANHQACAAGLSAR